MISLSDAKEYIHGIEDYYEACVRNKFRVPKRKSKLCTLLFLQEVRSRVCWVPMVGDIYPNSCATPPTVHAIQNELVAAIEANYDNVGPDDISAIRRFVWHLKQRPADKDFMLDVLSTIFKGQHHYFAKDYRPPPKRTAKTFVPMVSNHDGFFTNLPPSKRKSKANYHYRLLPVDEMQQLKHQQLQLRIQAL